MLLLVLLPLVVSVAAQVTTPTRPGGFHYKRQYPYPKIELEVFLDLVCPDSKAIWPHVKEVAETYGSRNVGLVAHLFPLPYHQNAFYASRATFVIHHKTNGSKTLNWIDKVFEKMSDINDLAFHNKSDEDLLNLFGTYASEIGLSTDDIRTFLELTDRRARNSYEGYTRIMWKQAASRGVYGTPTVFVNGIQNPYLLPSWNLTDWQKFLNPLLEPDLLDDVDFITIVDNQVTTTTTSAKPCTETTGKLGSTAPHTSNNVYLISWIIALIIYSS